MAGLASSDADAQAPPGFASQHTRRDENLLGARAIYLGSSPYCIHGSNEPDTIGAAISPGCVRMTNRGVMDLYDRVRTGTKIVVFWYGGGRPGIPKASEHLQAMGCA